MIGLKRIARTMRSPSTSATAQAERALAHTQWNQRLDRLMPHGSNQAPLS